MLAVEGSILDGFYFSACITRLLFLSGDEMQQFGSLTSLFSNILTEIIMIRIFVM